jgi:hypothetical protein
MKVIVLEDIELRSGSPGVWVEPGTYKVVRKLENGNYLVVLKELGKERQLTILRPEEVEVV